MFIPPATEISPARQRQAENGPSEGLRGAAAPSTASLVPTLRQTVSGVEVLHPSSNLPQNYHSMPQARIYHPKQAPSAVMSENFLTARAALNPGFMQNVAQTNIARVSNLYRDIPEFKNDLDILA
jgi:hypothetical protein